MKLALGTVQFGLDYGVSNQNGKTSAIEVRRLLDLAWHAGINTIDTAYHYGDSEAVLGDLFEVTSNFRVVTKTCSLHCTSISEADIDLVDKAFALSLKRLRQDSVAGILVHNPADLLRVNSDRLYQWLTGLRDTGKAAKIGVSVYAPEQVVQLLSYYDFDIIQVPFNLLDRRIITSGVMDRLHKSGVEIHVRSAFLQGLFFMSPSEIPASLAQARPYVEVIQQRARDADLPVQVLALGYLRRQTQVGKIVIGVNSVEQLAANLQAYAVTIEDDQVFDGLGCSDLSVIDPSTWEIGR